MMPSFCHHCHPENRLWWPEDGPPAEVPVSVVASRITVGEGTIDTVEAMLCARGHHYGQFVRRDDRGNLLLIEIGAPLAGPDDFAAAFYRKPIPA